MLTHDTAPEPVGAPAANRDGAVVWRLAPTDNVGWAHWVAWIVIIALAVLQALWYRSTLNPDGVAYLDLSDDVLAGHASGLVQGYWSPLFPVLLAAGRAIIGRSAAHETVVAHLVNAAGVVFALVGWRVLLRQVARRGEALMGLHTPVGVAAAYAVFVWGIFWVLSLHFVTPDVWLAGCVFVAAAMTIAHHEAAEPPPSIRLGVVLGIGYLTKAVLLPVSPFFIAGAVWLTPRGRRLRVALFAVVGVALVAGPWVAAISRHEGRATFGDNGRFNYGWFVSADRWMSPDPARETGVGSAVFPRVNETPAVYAWPDRAGTYAPWRDPSAFHAGMRPMATADQQAHVFKRSLRRLAFLVAPWLVAWLVLLAAGARIRWQSIRPAFAVLLPCVVALGGYAAVYVEGRYVAPFLSVMVLVAFAALVGDAAPAAVPPVVRAKAPRVALAVLFGAALWIRFDVRIPSMTELVVGMALLLLLVWRRGTAGVSRRLAQGALITLGALHVLSRSIDDASLLLMGEREDDLARPVQVALHSDGFPSEASIGVIGDGPSSAVWARPLRARVVAEVPASQAALFWTATDSARAVVARQMRAAGAQEMIATSALPARLPSGWRRVPGARVARYPLVEP